MHTHKFKGALNFNNYNPIIIHNLQLHIYYLLRIILKNKTLDSLL